MFVSDITACYCHSNYYSMDTGKKEKSQILAINFEMDELDKEDPESM